jgi:predicted transcriptional regulator
MSVEPAHSIESSQGERSNADAHLAKKEWWSATFEAAVRVLDHHAASLAGSARRLDTSIESIEQSAS